MQPTGNSNRAASAASPSPRDWAGLLRDHGLRATRAGVAVLRALDASDEPLTHDTLSQRVGAPDGGAIDRVTLYRLLERLAAAGLLQSLLGHDGVRRYVAVQSGAAGYFECHACHRVIALPDDPALPALLDRLQGQLRRRGLRSDDAALRVQGTCGDCVAPGDRR